MFMHNDQVCFKAVLRPNPPLPRVACMCLLAAVAAMNITIALIFVLRGAWPVAPFMGVDVLVLAWAFSSSSRAARAREELQLTSLELRIDFYPARGKAKHVGMNPYWLKVQFDESVWRRSAIILASHGRRLQIGSFLSPGDRVSFAMALIAALAFVRENSRL